MFNTHIRNEARLERLMEIIGVSPEGIDLMGKKGRQYIIKLESVPIKDAIILKQEALSVGGDCALSWSVLGLNTDSTDAILILTERQMEILTKKMEYQPFNGRIIAEELREIVGNYENEPALTLRGRRVNSPAVMGILNVTPDSFSDGGKYLDFERAVKRGKQMVKEGADIIDIGGESSRPGSGRVSAAEEMERVLPVVEALRKETDAIISVDTYKPEVAERAIDAGADMINDIYGLRKEGMAELIGQHGVGVVIMHMQGDPENMQENPQYRDVIADISRFLRAQAEKALDAGISIDSIVIDPGIGFGKTVEHNLQIIKELGAFRSLGYPVLVGASRKSFIGKTLDLHVEERLEGSLAVAVIAVQKGVSIIRTHDVMETVRAVKMTMAVESI